MDRGGSRRLETPGRDASRVPDNRRDRDRKDVASRSHSHLTDRTRSRSRRNSRDHSSFRERERELENECERLNLLKRQLQRDREYRRSKRRSERRSKDRDDHQHLSGLNVNSEPVCSKNPPKPDTRDACRERSPSYSTKDLIHLLSSLKSQPLTPSANNKSIDHKNILPNFDPSTKNQRIDIWLKKVNECASVYGWDERTTTHFAMQKLQGLAKVWYEGLNSILFSWAEWQIKLQEAFPCEQNFGQTLEDMLRRKSRFTEPIEVYFYEKLALINQCDITGKRAVDCIIHGLSDKTMKSSALALRCTSPEQLLQFLISNKDTTTYNDRPYNKNKNWSASVGSASNSQPNPKNNFKPGAGVYCYNCKERGHPYLQCPKPLIKCERCFKVGHKTEVCRENNKNNKLENIPKTMCISDSNPSSKFIKEAKINGMPVEVFVDFGSEVTLIKECLLIKHKFSHDCVQSTMKGFGNGLVKSLGNVTLEIEIDGVKATVSCKVVDDSLLDRPLLIGQSFTEQPHVIVYKDSLKLRFLDIGSEVANPKTDENLSLKVSVTDDVELFGPASIKASTGDKFSGRILLSDRLIGRPNQELLVSGGLYKVEKGLLHVTVNPCRNPYLLRQDMIISRAEKVNVVNRIATETSRVPCSTVIDESSVKVGEAASEDDRQRLLKLLNQYKHCFASNLQDLGCTNVTEMSIELNDKNPIVYRPYRLSHHEREKVRNMVDEMLEADIIRESTSQFSSPIILVRKKEGGVRMCVDYRMLNAATVKERYPMPIIEDEIARLTGQACFITLDLASGYYQVPIAENCKHLTSFVTPDGQFEFNRMPFGLANAPAVFQRMMNRILGSARFNKATAYIDDVLIYGRDPSECLQRLEEILSLIENARLTLNLSKCHFLMSKIDYLGYEISSEGVKPGEKKIQCVMQFPQPDNVHKVRQFLGLVSYFRKFIQNFAQIAYPLTRLLKKDAIWEWNSAQDEAFKALKAKLVDRPVLAIYNPHADLQLHTDASKNGIGGILLQRSNNDEHLRPVAFFSRQTSPEEKNFHSYELETLAVICSLKKFRVFLIGKEFKILTDCSALRSTFLKRDLIPRIARWWLTLQEFNCTIEYKAGSKMGHVDALSRNPIQDDETLCTDSYPSVMTINQQDWLHTLQLGDSELRRTKEIVSNDMTPKDLQHIKDNYVVKDNKLFRCINGDRNDLRWVVPKGARWQVCKMNHDDIGHFGVEKTLDRIKRHYWFPKINKFVKKYVSACMECAFAKQNTSGREGLLNPIDKNEVPFHTLHADHLGPFVKSKQGNSYLLVVVDGFSKFVFIKPVRNTKTVCVTKVLDDIFFTFKGPVRLITDQGSCFTSHTFKKFCIDRGIKHILNAVASPRANGQVERYNRTILNSLKAQNLNFNEKDWDNKVGKIQWGMNNTVQKTTGKMPSEIMFGTLGSCEINPKFDEILQNINKPIDLPKVRQEVKDKIVSEQIKQKEYYDQGRRPARLYNEGDLVKITKTSFNNDGKSKKLLPSYIGPYRVTKVLGNDRYKVSSIPGFSNIKRKRKTTVAADRIKPWVHVAALDLHKDSDTSDNDELDGQE